MSVEAMKQALEALEEVKSWKSPTRWDGCFDEEITSLRQAIEQAVKQEPVAWVNWCAATGKRSVSFECESELASQPLYFGITQITQNHYSKQIQWNGLTQEDIDIAFDDTQEGGGFNEFAEAIEQMLRRKNT